MFSRLRIEHLEARLRARSRLAKPTQWIGTGKCIRQSSFVLEKGRIAVATRYRGDVTQLGFVGCLLTRSCVVFSFLLEGRCLGGLPI